MKPVFPWLFTLFVVACAARFAVAHYPWWTAGSSMEQEDKWFPLFIGGIITLVLSVVACGIGCVVSDFIGNHSEQVWCVRWSRNMVAMKSVTGPHGSLAGGIFMVHGTIGTSQVYTFYTEEGTAFKPHTWKPNSDTYIFEEDRTDGKVIQSECRFAKPWVVWFGNPWERYKMDFYIPKGSLKQKFTLD